MTGAVLLVRSDPVTDVVPLMCNSGISALMVTVTAAAAGFRACQVPLQRPSPSRAKASGGAPLGKPGATGPPPPWGPPVSRNRTFTREGARAGARKTPGSAVD